MLIKKKSKRKWLINFKKGNKFSFEGKRFKLINIKFKTDTRYFLKINFIGLKKESTNIYEYFICDDNHTDFIFDNDN